MPQNIKQIATIGGERRIDPFFSWEGAEKLRHKG